MKMRGVPFVFVAAAIALAACGSSSSSGSTAKTVTTQPTTPQSATSPPVVKTASNAKLGSLFVDSKGMTLYTLTSSGQPVACTGQCAKFWPPLVLPAGTTTAVGAAGVTGLATASGANGLQVTENGAPLYRFSGDMAPGSANGEGISSFGGVWHVVRASGAGAVTTNPPATNAPLPSTTNGYGY